LLRWTKGFTGVFLYWISHKLGVSLLGGAYAVDETTSKFSVFGSWLQQRVFFPLGSAVDMGVVVAFKRVTTILGLFPRTTLLPIAC